MEESAVNAVRRLQLVRAAGPVISVYVDRDSPDPAVRVAALARFAQATHAGVDGFGRRMARIERSVSRRLAAEPTGGMAVFCMGGEHPLTILELDHRVITAVVVDDRPDLGQVEAEDAGV